MFVTCDRKRKGVGVRQSYIQPRALPLSGQVKFCSFPCLSFLFCQTEITPSWQGLCGLKEITAKCPSPVYGAWLAQNNQKPGLEGSPSLGCSKAFAGKTALQRPGCRDRWWMQLTRARHERPAPLSLPGAEPLQRTPSLPGNSVPQEKRTEGS